MSKPRCLNFEKPRRRSQRLLGRVSTQNYLDFFCTYIFFSFIKDSFFSTKVYIINSCHHFAVRIKKKSRVPGVMITQFVEELPEGMTTPDFTRKPIAITIQEGMCDKTS